jgi:predicted ArsR family transcriptional regulator
MTAPTLFDVLAEPLPVRSNDPATSRVAARSVNMRERKREVIDSMTRLAGTVTASQIQADLARHGIVRESGSIRSRLSQLREDGLVATVGVRVVPKPAGTGRPEQTWRLT